MGIRCFVVEYDPERVFYMLEEDNEWRGPVLDDEVPEEWQARSHAMRMPDGTLARASDLPPGAMYDYMKCPNSSIPDAYKDRAVNGQYLVCVIPPNHHWQIDSRASNCTRPDDDTHRCWVREGEPPNITAGKEGNTCDAGGGSIQTPEWHGFLRGGELVST